MTGNHSPIYLPQDLETRTWDQVLFFRTALWYRNSQSATLRETRHNHCPILYNRRPMRQTPPFVFSVSSIPHRDYCLRSGSAHHSKIRCTTYQRGYQIHTGKSLRWTCVRDPFGLRASLTRCNDRQHSTSASCAGCTPYHPSRLDVPPQQNACTTWSGAACVDRVQSPSFPERKKSAAADVV